MIKSFFKNHPIHKKIVPYLDFIFLFYPVNFFLVWAPICIGMYIANTQSGQSPQWILALNFKVGILFLALTMTMASFFLQFSKIGSEKNNYKLIGKYLFYFGFFLLFFLNLYNLVLGLIVSIIFKFVYPKIIEDKKLLYSPFLNIAFCALLIINGYCVIATSNSYFSIDINFLSIIRILIYTMCLLSITLLITLKNNLNIISSSRKINVLLPTLLILLSFVFGIYFTDPLLSVTTLVSAPFFLYALLRNLDKDVMRAVIYPIFIFNFFISTIYPYLFICLFIIFYISKYYYWHRFDFHYPTFLVKND